MLFDIRGRRRRFIQVIYVFLALLLGGGLVLLGIGGDANGGILSIFGLDGNSSSPRSANYDGQIERAQENLDADPNDQKALTTLARYQYLAGNDSTEVDDEGGVLFTEDAEDRFQASVDAWERYLATDPTNPDDGVASLVLQAYGQVASDPDLTVAQRYLEGAQETAKIVAEERPTTQSFFQVAAYSYFDGKVGEGDAAADKAIQAAKESGGVDDPDALKSLQQQLDRLKTQGKSLQQQIKAASAGQEDLDNPLGDLGSSPSDPGAAGGTDGTGLPGAPGAPSPTP